MYEINIQFATIPLSIISIFFIQNEINNKKEEALRSVKLVVNDIQSKTTLLLTHVRQEMIMLSNTSEVKKIIQNPHNPANPKQNNQINNNELETEFVSLFKDDAIS